MNPEVISELLNELRALPFFPSDEYVIVALVRMVGAMASSEDQVRWLVARMTSGIYAQWPGPQEMRACFCSRFKPRDGINVYSQVYPDGIPASKPLPPQLGCGEMRLLPAVEAGEPISHDPGLEAAVHIAAKVIDLKNRAFSGPATAEEIHNAPEWLKEIERGYGR